MPSAATSDLAAPAPSPERGAEGEGAAPARSAAQRNASRRRRRFRRSSMLRCYDRPESGSLASGCVDLLEAATMPSLITSEEALALRPS